MPGLAVKGRSSKLEVSSDGGVTFQPFGGLVDVSLDGNVDELETTTHDSVSREYIPNFSDATLTISARWFDGDPGQDIVTNSIGQSSFQFRFYMQQVTGKRRFEGSAFSTSFSISGPLDDTGMYDLDFRVSALTIVTQ